MIPTSETLHGTWPHPYEVVDNRAHGTILLRTPYYEITHDRRQGGAISSIRYFYGSGENLLLDAMRSQVTLPDGTYTDIADPAPSITIQPGDDETVITVEGMLRNAGGQESNIPYRYAYSYRWGYVRVRKQFTFPESGVAVRRLQVHGGSLRPELGHYGVRPGAPAEAATDPADSRCASGAGCAPAPRSIARMKAGSCRAMS